MYRLINPASHVAKLKLSSFCLHFAHGQFESTSSILELVALPLVFLLYAAIPSSISTQSDSIDQGSFLGQVSFFVSGSCLILLGFDRFCFPWGSLLYRLVVVSIDTTRWPTKPGCEWSCYIPTANTGLQSRMTGHYDTGT